MTMHRDLLCRLLLAALTLLSGCKDNACENRPAEAQIDVQMFHVGEAAFETEVRLVVNGGDPLVRLFPFVRSLTFVFELGELNEPPHELEVEVIVRDARGNSLTSNSLVTSFLPNGCNFFTIELDEPPPDAGPDGIVGG